MTIVKQYNFACFFHCTLAELIDKLISVGVKDIVEECGWGTITITGIFRDTRVASIVDQFVVVWDVKVLDATKFNIFKLKHPDQYDTIQALSEEGELKKEEDFDTDEYANVTYYVMYYFLKTLHGNNNLKT